MARKRFAPLSILVVLPVLLLSASCRTVEPAESANKVWVAPDWVGDLGKPDAVWADLRSRQAAFPKPLTPADLAAMAIQNSPATRQAWDNARAARAQEQQARSAYYPQATASGKVTRDHKEATDPQADFDGTIYGPKLDITYLLLDLGGRSGTADAAREQLIAASYQYNQAIQDLLLSVALAYFGLYSGQAEQDSAAATVEDAKATLDAAQAKFDAKIGTRLDVLQAQSEYDNALFALEDAKGKVKTAKGDLAQVVGLPADAAFEIAKPAAPAPENIPDQDITALIEDGLTNRQDVAAARAGLRAKEAAVKAANSQLWPTLVLGGSADANWYDDTDLAETDDNEVLGYVGLQWDLFNGFKNTAEKRAAQAAADAARAQLAQTELAVSADVWSKWYNYKTAVSKLQFSRSARDSAEESYNLALEGYQNGLNSLLDLIQVQGTLTGARSQVIAAENDVFVALANVGHALGGLQEEHFKATEITP